MNQNKPVRGYTLIKNLRLIGRVCRDKLNSSDKGKDVTPISKEYWFHKKMTKAVKEWFRKYGHENVWEFDYEVCRTVSFVLEVCVKETEVTIVTERGNFIFDKY